MRQWAVVVKTCGRIKRVGDVSKKIRDGVNKASGVNKVGGGVAKIRGTRYHQKHAAPPYIQRSPNTAHARYFRHDQDRKRTHVNITKASPTKGLCTPDRKDLPIPPQRRQRIARWRRYFPRTRSSNYTLRLMWHQECLHSTQGSVYAVGHGIQRSVVPRREVQKQIGLLPLRTDNEC